MTRYQITATVERREGEWTRSTQVPTFYLDGDVQGIMSAEHAETVARDVIDPLQLMTVHAVAVAVPDPLAPVRDTFDQIREALGGSFPVSLTCAEAEALYELLREHLDMTEIAEALMLAHAFSDEDGDMHAIVRDDDGEPHAMTLSQCASCGEWTARLYLGECRDCAPADVVDDDPDAIDHYTDTSTCEVAR